MGVTQKRSVLATIGPAITMIGLLCVLAGSQSGRSPLFITAGQVLIAGGIVLLVVLLWRQHAGKR